jgi:hypothetical protein
MLLKAQKQATAVPSNPIIYSVVTVNSKILQGIRTPFPEI